MPKTTRLYVKMSIVYLCLGAVIGALLLINRWTPLGPAVAALKGSHVALLVVGWLTQLIFGVAWWLFPALKIRLHPAGLHPHRRGQTQRGSETLFWFTFACLNAGVVLHAVLSPLRVVFQTGPLEVLADLLLVAAAITFVGNGMWVRVRELGKAGQRADADVNPRSAAERGAAWEER
jgi:hypothetical protein